MSGRGLVKMMNGDGSTKRLIVIAAIIFMPEVATHKIDGSTNIYQKYN
jgi:hypothetical protein